VGTPARLRKAPGATGFKFAGGVTVTVGGGGGAEGVFVAGGTLLPPKLLL
jgi:hypothetical protein